jgi:uncharacterized membrane protein
MMRWSGNPQHFDGWDRHMGGGGTVGMVLMAILWVAVIAALVLGIRALILHDARGAILSRDADRDGRSPGGRNPYLAGDPGGTLRPR